MDILIIYQFCSFGGVERAILNRVMAFKNHGVNVKIHVGYLHDHGALDAYKNYIRLNHLEKRIIPFLMSENFSFDQSNYDLVSIIDTPQILGEIRQTQNVFIECHTPYVENRQYLTDIPENIKAVIVPSESFRSLLKFEFPKLKEIFVLPNPIPDDFYRFRSKQPVFGKRPLAYLARLDDLKNFSEAVQIFDSFRKHENIFHIVIGRGGELAERISKLQEMNLLERTFLRESIPFDKVPELINIVKDHRGVFISPSQGESFGLSAAEFICGGVPVLLSDIPAHRELVNNDDRFLYPLGDIKTARIKLEYILDQWDSLSKDIEKYAGKFKSNNFLSKWILFLKKYKN